MSRANPFLSGQIRETWVEHRACNAASFSSVFSSDSWELTAGVDKLSPARIAAGQNFNRDLVAYTAIPADSSFHDHLAGQQSPARPTANGGAIKKGQAT